MKELSRYPRGVAVYARKSKITESGKSVENQITKCKSYANLKFDVHEDDIFVYQDEGLSGYYSDRPAYMQMLRDIADNKIRAVVCYKFDRISRKTLDLLNLVEQLRVKKIAFISCTDDVDTSSKTGKIVMSLLASIAEFERDIIAERIADSYHYFKSFNVPIYALESDFEGVRGLMVYNKTEQVKELREDSTTVHPAYISRHSRREVVQWIISVGQHKGIVSGKEWVAVQGVLHDNRSRYAQPNEQSHSLLSGLLICPVCGEKMYTRKQSGRYNSGGLPRYNYVCKAKYANRATCNSKEIGGNDLEQLTAEQAAVGEQLALLEARAYLFARFRIKSLLRC